MKVGAKHSERSILAPRPVHPRAVGYHGLFGEVYVKQHMMIEDFWTPNALKEQFKRMAKLLAKRLQFSHLEKKAKNKRILLQSHQLRRQCRDGRNQLHTIRAGDTQGVRNLLLNHKEMQRLYQQMPPHLVHDNIIQRTFVMRKEQDRLLFRLGYLDKVYGDKRSELGSLQNRVKFENEFLLDEERRCWDLRKQVENVHSRLSAVKAINGTYRKIVQVLKQDEIFYEPILRSLDRDIQDQGGFIKHILYLGSPALERFKELGEQFRTIDEKARKSIHSSIQQCSSFIKYGDGKVQKSREPNTESEMFIRIERRYERETRSMINLKNELEQIEETIKKIKFTTLCSQPKDLYPRIKSQVDNNHKLQHMIDKNLAGYDILEAKAKYASVFQAVLTNNFDETGIKSLEKIKHLEEAMKNEDDFQEMTLAHIKNRTDLFVLLRFALWNLHEIMHDVDPKRVHQSNYPSSELKLPLLKFDMLDTKACPPSPYEENISALLLTVIRKLRLLLSFLETTHRRRSTAKLRELYCHEMLDAKSNVDAKSQYAAVPSIEEVDVALEMKAWQHVPDRKQIKMASARLVEQMMKKGQ